MFFLSRRNPNRTEDARGKQPSNPMFIPFMTREEMEREREKKRQHREELEKIEFEESD